MQAPELAAVGCQYPEAPVKQVILQGAGDPEDEPAHPQSLLRSLSD